ncbi:MAG: MBOAT family protein [Lachnospiraceae bacterium]|nr:MBOAT family protein [Lachnospiraceae bacterium]
MLFNSYLFIFIFLPISLLVWFFLNNMGKNKAAQVFLVAMSIWFYAYFNYSYIWIILGSCIFNFGCSLGLEKFPRARKPIGIFGIAGNLAILFYYKYFDFFLENINFLFKKDFPLFHILLPLGISFFTFQQLSYVVDRMKGEAPHYGLVDYLSFVTFFPQLIAGPIVLHTELIPQFQDKEKRKFNLDNFTDGCVQSILGLGKKILIADTLGLVVNQTYFNRYYLTTWSTIIFILAYAFELYFDFSGYCDIAMGVGKMFNFTIPANFDSPYRSRSMKEFWNRWHITLSRFFITYVYIPLGGSKKGEKRKLINTMIVFLLSGLWHGASWNYVAWGFLNGLGVIFSSRKKEASGHKFLSWLGCFSYFLFTLIFFRSESMQDVGIILKGLFNPVGIKFIYDMAQYMDIPELYVFRQAFQLFLPEYQGMVYLVAFLLLMLLCIILLRGKNPEQFVKEGKYTKKTVVALSVIFIWSVISLSGVSTFLYFNF